MPRKASKMGLLFKEIIGSKFFPLRAVPKEDKQNI